MHISGIPLKNKEAYAKFEEILLNKDMDMSLRQWFNFIGSGKVWSEVEGKRKYFDSEHIADVAQRYTASGGMAYSIYRYDKYAGKLIEYINSYQCTGLWNYSDRQVQNIIASGKVPNIKVGREYFVPQAEALAYRAKLQYSLNVAP